MGWYYQPKGSWIEQGVEEEDSDFTFLDVGVGCSPGTKRYRCLKSIGDEGLEEKIRVGYINL